MESPCVICHPIAIRGGDGLARAFDGSAWSSDVLDLPEDDLAFLQEVIADEEGCPRLVLI